MWMRQCDWDASQGAFSPIPTRIASNEEYVPPPQSEHQKRFEARVHDLSEAQSKKLGIPRRAFLKTGAGMAAALLAFNEVFGRCYDVETAEMEEPGAFEEKWPKNQFIFDMQTHHVDVARKWYDDTAESQSIQRFFRSLRPAIQGIKKTFRQ